MLLVEYTQLLYKVVLTPLDSLMVGIKKDYKHR